VADLRNNNTPRIASSNNRNIKRKKIYENIKYKIDLDIQRNNEKHAALLIQAW
jgi:hypothetical protein